MNRKTLKGFALGMATTAVIGAAATPAIASNLKKMVELTYKDIKITLNGQQITPTDANGNAVEPFIMDGSTYLPVRGVANALDLDVTWDNNTNTVVLKDKTKQQLTEESKFSRTNPAPIGTAQSIAIDDYLRKYNCEVKITESYRGDEAYTRIKAENGSFNIELNEGKEYILAKVKATVSNVADDKKVSLSGYSFDIYSAKGTEYTESTFVSVPSPRFSGDLYEGASLEGWVAYTVDKTDTAPVAVFGQNYDGTGGIWFKLTY